jgi:hypothetical protein
MFCISHPNLKVNFKNRGQITLFYKMLYQNDVPRETCHFILIEIEITRLVVLIQNQLLRKYLS